jgi:hypothetical protein
MPSQSNFQGFASNSGQSRFENASDNLRNFGAEYAMSFRIQVNPVLGTKAYDLSCIEKITTQPSGMPSIMAS